MSSGLIETFQFGFAFAHVARRASRRRDRRRDEREERLVDEAPVEDLAGVVVLIPAGRDRDRRRPS
jgi:hypothetical protein